MLSRHRRSVPGSLSERLNFGLTTTQQPNNFYGSRNDPFPAYPASERYLFSESLEFRDDLLELPLSMQRRSENGLGNSAYRYRTESLSHMISSTRAICDDNHCNPKTGERQLPRLAKYFPPC